MIVPISENSREVHNWAPSWIVFRLFCRLKKLTAVTSGSNVTLVAWVQTCDRVDV